MPYHYHDSESRLLRWIICSMTLLGSSFSDVPKISKETTKISLKTMKNYATEIAKHQDTNPIPDWILREIRLIINARKEFNEFYRECARLTPNPSLLRSNVGDEARIQNLIEILEILDTRDEDNEALMGSQEILDTIDEDNEALMGSQEIQERAIFRNSFSGLTLDSQLRENDKESSSGGSKNNGVSTPHQSSTASNKSKHKHEKDSAKGNQRSTKGNQRISRTPPRLEEMLEERPLEDYRIDDQPYKLDDYLMAIYSLFKEIMKLRYYLQDIWSEVVYDNLDIAIAGCLCNIAIQKIKEAQSDVFIENPRFDSFDSVAQVITAGEPKRPFCMKALSDENRERHINHIIKELYTRKMGRNATNINFDVKEEFLFNSYQALLDFLVDYKKSNNGSPTKRMLRTIKDWEPFLNFERACKGDRLSWRRAFTIGWLYELVYNFHSSPVQQGTSYQRIYGINELAADITRLAVQVPMKEIRSKINPHHVFQLQCIVDSLAVSRGWFMVPFTGDAVRMPPRSFQPFRDINFLKERNSISFLSLISEYNDELQRHQILRKRPSTKILQEIREAFSQWFGGIQRSQGTNQNAFPARNSIAFWEYCPFLCSVGLVAALDLTYRVGLSLLDDSTSCELFCIIHLHSMIVQEGHLTRPDGLWGMLQGLFQSFFFYRGEVPISDYSTKFESIWNLRQVALERNEKGKKRNDTMGKDLNNCLDPDKNVGYKQRSLLQIYNQAQWRPDRVAIEEVPHGSGLYRILESRKKERREFRGSPHPGPGKESFEGLADLDLLKGDFINHICGVSEPICGFNYLLALKRSRDFILRLEKSLKSSQGELWSKTLKDSRTGFANEKDPVDLTRRILESTDPQCLRTLLREFQKSRTEIGNYEYWGPMYNAQSGNVFQAFDRHGSLFDADTCPVQ